MSHKTIFIKNKNALKTIYLRRFFLDFMHFSSRHSSTQIFYKMWYNKSRRVIYMKELYQKSLQMIKELSKILTEKEWNKYAVENNLLSSISLKYISGKKFTRLCKEVRANI
nr:MAG TPA: hypothetical protein [Caudoviricetes sp.]